MRDHTDHFQPWRIYVRYDDSLSDRGLVRECLRGQKLVDHRYVAAGSIVFLREGAPCEQSRAKRFEITWEDVSHLGRLSPGGIGEGLFRSPRSAHEGPPVLEREKGRTAYALDARDGAQPILQLAKKSQSPPRLVK